MQTVVDHPADDWALMARYIRNGLMRDHERAKQAEANRQLEDTMARVPEVRQAVLQARAQAEARARMLAGPRPSGPSSSVDPAASSSPSLILPASASASRARPRTC